MAQHQINVDSGQIVPTKSADQEEMFEASPETMALLRSAAGLALAEPMQPQAIAQSQSMGGGDRLPLYCAMGAGALVMGCGFLLTAMAMSPNARVEAIARESIAANASVANAVTARPTCRAIGLIVMAGACPGETAPQPQQPFVSGTEIAAVGGSGLVQTPPPPPPSGQAPVTDQYLQWAAHYPQFDNQVLLDDWQTQQCESVASDRCLALDKELELRGL